MGMFSRSALAACSLIALLSTQANAETADATKQQNAVAALDARNTYADKTLVRKEGAETKAAESQARHADDNAKVSMPT